MPELVATVMTPTSINLQPAQLSGMIKTFLDIAKKTISQLPIRSEQEKIKCEQCWQ
jgi:hypothetical protein